MLLEAVAQHGGGQVPDVEALGNVNGGIVQADGLSLALTGGAILLPGGKHAFEGVPGKVHPVEEEVQVAVHRLHAGGLRGVEGLGQGLGNLRRGHAQRFGKAEAGEGVIPQLGFRGNLQQGTQLLRLGKLPGLGPGLAQGVRQELGDAGFHIHGKFAPSSMQ